MTPLLIHNHDTSIKTFAKFVNDTLMGIPNLNGSPELDLCGRDIVSLTQVNLAQDIEKIITSLNNETNIASELLPQIIIARSNVIQPSQFGRMTKKFQFHDAIKIANKDNPEEFFYMSGQMFTYETPVQIVILTRSQYASKELALHLLNIMANNGKINYKLRLHDKENPNVFYAVEDYGHLNLVGVKSLTFSESTVQQSGIVALGAEFTIREQFFMLKNDPYIMEKYIVEVGG